MLMGAMTLVIVSLVITRYIFNYSFPWAEELTRYMMVWMALLGVSVVMRNDEHISMTYLIDRLPRIAAYYARIVFRFGVLTFIVVLAKEGISTAVFMLPVTSPSMYISMFFVYLAIPVASLFCGLYLISSQALSIRRLVLFYRTPSS